MSSNEIEHKKIMIFHGAYEISFVIFKNNVKIILKINFCIKILILKYYYKIFVCIIIKTFIVKYRMTDLKKM